MTMKTSTALLAAAFAIALVGSSSVAQDRQDGQNQNQDAQRSRASKTDMEFVRKAAMSDMAEIQMGQIALERASHADVKAFAQRMVDDHTKSSQELMQIVQSKNMTLPTEPDRKMQQMAERMRRMSGNEFDRHYMDHMVGDHKKAVELFERQSERGTDPELKAFAARTLPTLREHHRMSVDIHARVKNAGRGGDTQGRTE
jgi:putative membrane protein